MLQLAKNQERPSHGDARPSQIVVVAASLGGLRTVTSVLGAIPAEFPLPIVVVQHLSDRYPSYFVEAMRPKLQLPVRWIGDRRPLTAGVVHVAPPGRHVVIDEDKQGRLSDMPRVNFARPAADLLFRSAAERFRNGTIAVVLTGRLFDGASGALEVRRAGGLVIAQDPTTCAAPGMPNAAIDTGAVHFVLPPNAIARALIALAMVSGVPAMFGWRSDS